ncbi:CCAAT/enhancer-binding protein zeta [Anopheles bellator]|uniref:CCAAT/enhancer-binding protein zeta n=1 Tax=Anopheles bellator TaxID=139047 RepID=UPI002648A6B9|nr:CCAAT/enhancer-binding protein zeta [Anopheles bellator]
MVTDGSKVKKKDARKRYFEQPDAVDEKQEPSTQKPKKIIFDDDGEQREVPVTDTVDPDPPAGHKRKYQRKGSSFTLPGDDDEPVKRWYDHYDGYNTVGEVVEMKDAEIEELRKLCKTAFEAECRIRTKDNPSDARWLQSAMEKGTSRDRASSAALLVQSNPFCNLDALETVIAMVKPSNKGHQSVVEVVTELMLKSLMPASRKLISIPLRGADWRNVQRQELPKSIRDPLLAHWHFEDRLRELYFNFLTNLSVVLHSGQDDSKCKTIVYTSRLFADVPEKEAFLLTVLTNKLGDPSRPVAVKALYHLQQVVRKHSAMASIVAAETEKLLFRNNVSSTAQHYGLSFLSSIAPYGDFATCQKLINICFAFFKILTERGEINSRTMQAILACLRKAIGSVKRDVAVADIVQPELLNVIYRMVHLADIAIGCQGLSLLLEVTEKPGREQNRFYNTLYRKLLDPQLASVGPRISTVFFYILHRALQNDPIPDRALAFIKRLLQVSYYFPPARVCGTLIVISKVLRKRRQLLQPDLPLAPSLDDEEPDNQGPILAPDGEEEEDKKPTKKPPGPVLRYDAFHRVSEFAGAKFTLRYELVRYLEYFHPTVQKFAECILTNTPLSYYGDPLRDFSLGHFLDRFAFKNPKKLKTTTDANGEEVARPRPLGVAQRKSDYVPKGSRALAVEELTKERCTEDEQYIFQFLERKRERSRRAVERKKALTKDDDDGAEDEEEEESDVDSLDDDDFDAYLDRLGVPGGRDDSANVDKSELDFMTELEQEREQKANRRKRGKKDDPEDDDGDDAALDDWVDVEGDEDEGGEESDGEYSDGEDDADDADDGEFSDGGSISLDEELAEGDDDGDEEEQEMSESEEEPVVKKKKKAPKSLGGASRISDRDFARKLKSTDVNSLFAAADDFSELLEGNVGLAEGKGAGKKAGGKQRKQDPFAHGTDMEVFNQDGSSVKQLAWEQSRLSDQRNRCPEKFRKRTGAGKSLGGKKRK